MGRGRLAAVLVAVLALAVAVPSGAMSSRDDAAPAEASAKKKKKKCRKGYKKVRVHGKVKCKKRKAGTNDQNGSNTTPTPTPAPAPVTQDPRTRFLAMFNNSGFYRPINTTSGSGEEIYNFCANGYFINRYTSPYLGNDYRTEGTWELVDVKTGTLLGYNIVEGYVKTSGMSEGEAKQSDLYIDLSELAPNIAYISNKEYTRITPYSC